MGEDHAGGTACPWSVQINFESLSHHSMGLLMGASMAAGCPGGTPHAVSVTVCGGVPTTSPLPAVDVAPPRPAPPACTTPCPPLPEPLPPAALAAPASTPVSGPAPSCGLLT